MALNFTRILNKLTDILTQKLLNQKLKASEAPRTILEAKRQKELESTESDDDEDQFSTKKNRNVSKKASNEDINLELITDKADMLYICPFRFEKEKKPKNDSKHSSSEESLNFEELADFNKIMENQFRETIDKEFHEKFHTIQNIQNKDINKKLEIMSKQRNTGQLKYLLKKKVNNFKENIKEVKTQLEKLDDAIQEFPDSARKGLDFFERKRYKSMPDGFTNLRGVKFDKDGNPLVDDEYMKKAFERFRAKYNVQTEEDMLQIISKLKNK